MSLCGSCVTSIAGPNGHAQLYERWRCYGASGEGVAPSARFNKPTECPMSQPFDASKSLTTLEQDSTVIAVIEMSQSKWLVAAVVPGVERQPLKKLEADEEALLKLLYRWRTESSQAGHT